MRRSDVEQLVGFTVDSVLTAVNGNGITAGMALKAILPAVLELLNNDDWNARVRAQAQSLIDRSLRELGLITGRPES